MSDGVSTGVALQAEGLWGPIVTTSMSAKEMAPVSSNLSALPVSVFVDCHAKYLIQALLSSYTTLSHL